MAAVFALGEEGHLRRPGGLAIAGVGMVDGRSRKRRTMPAQWGARGMVRAGKWCLIGTLLCQTERAPFKYSCGS